MADKTIFDDPEFAAEAEKIDELAAQLPEELPALNEQVIEAVPTAGPMGAVTTPYGEPTKINPNAAVGGVPLIPDFLAQEAVNPKGLVTPMANQVMTSFNPILDPVTGATKLEGTTTPTSAENTFIERAPVQLTEKVGEEQTTSYQRSPELNKRIKEIDAIKKEQADAAQKVVNEINVIADDKAKLDAVRSEEGQKIAAEAQRLYTQAESERQYYRNEIEQKRQELASMKPETFWGSKSAADKIMLALSVGLGAWGQAEIGGQNIGLALLMKNMEEHDSLQKQKFKQVESELSLLQNYSVDAQKVINNQFTSLKALDIAQRDKLDAMLGSLESKVKTENERLKIIDARTKIQADITQKQAELEKDILQRTTRTDFIKGVTGVVADPKAPYQVNGQPMSVEQSKKHALVLTGGEAEHIMSQLEDKAQLTKTQAYADYYKAKQRHLELFASGRMGGELYSSVKGLMNSDPELRAILAANPDLTEYDRMNNQYLEELLREKTGAAIAANEEGNLLRVILPKPGSDNLSDAARDKDLQVSRDARRRYLRTARTISNSGIKFYFEEGK
jgi:hypothetical protein